MIRRIVRITGYLILFVLNAFLLWYFHSFLNLSILILMLFLPIASIVITKLVADRVTLEWEGPYDAMCKNEEFQIRLKLMNPMYFGVMNCKLRMEVANLFYETSREHELRAPLRARHGQTITYPVTANQSGRIEFRTIEATLEDFFGFAAYHRSFSENFIVYVLPHETSEVLTDLNGYTNGMTEVEESSKKGSDFSEVQDIREYQPGDRLQNIHWKLSVKKDMLMVKERVSMSSRQLFLMLELHDNENGLLEDILDCTYGICRFMLDNQIPLSMCWWSQNTQELMIWKVDDISMLEEGFRMLFFEKLYQEQTLGRDMFAAVRGAEQQFLWIGNRNFGMGEPLMEYGKDAGVFYGAIS